MIKMIRKLSMEELNRVSVEKFKELDKWPLVCILDNLRSQHNIGSVFRTSDAFRVEEIILCGITATPPNREINKTALGATESVKWRYVESTAEAVKKLRKNGFRILAVEQAENSLKLDDFRIHAGEKIALIFGNEVMGVSDEVMGLVDECLEIPQFGTKHSLNVSVTAGIVLWQMYQLMQNPVG